MSKILIKNGKIFSLDMGSNVYSSMFIEDGYIKHIGKEGSEYKADSGTEIIDLEGRIVLPGFYDSHVHILSVGRATMELDLHEIESIEKLKEKLENKVRATKPGVWIFGAGWMKDLWHDVSFPTHHDIDPVSPENPVALYSKDRHTLLLNSTAIELLGITGETEFEGFGEVTIDEKCNPTGILKEDACELLRKRISKAENIEGTLLEAFSAFLKNGITSVDTMSHTENYHDLFTELQKLDRSGELPLRIDVYFPDAILDTLVKTGITSGFGSDHLKVGGIKIFADGALGSQTAHLIEPYCSNPNNFGISTITQDKLDHLLRESTKNDLRCGVHAIGDAAVQKAINSFLQVNANYEYEKNPSNIRHRIEHLQLIQQSDIPRLVKSGGIASVQPIHVSADIDIAKKYWGDRCEFSYPYKTLLDAGIPLIMGSDAPIEDMNPMKGIYAAISRKSLFSRREESFYPEQNLSRLQAVFAYTVTPHILKGNKKITGSIEVGKIADLVVLSDNIFEIDEEKIPEIKVDVTICDGKIVYVR